MGGPSRISDPDRLDDLGVVGIVLVVAAFAALELIDQVRDRLKRLGQLRQALRQRAEIRRRDAYAMPFGDVPHLGFSAAEVSALSHGRMIAGGEGVRDSHRRETCE